MRGKVAKAAREITAMEVAEHGCDKPGLIPDPKNPKTLINRPNSFRAIYKHIKKDVVGRA